MIPLLGELLERFFGLPVERTVRVLTRIAVFVAATLFLLLSTGIVAFDSIFPSPSAVATLTVGDVAPRDITAPETLTYVSRVQTEQRRQDARDAVRPIYNSPDLNVARVQSRQVHQILEFIDNVRRDPYADSDQRSADIRQITALTLDDAIIQQVLQLTDEMWEDVADEVVRLLEQVMQESIRDSELAGVIERLPVQVSLRFTDQEVGVIVAVVEDLVRPNTTPNNDSSELARQQAAAAIPDVVVTLQRGEIIVNGGSIITTREYEALEQLGLLQPTNRRLPEVGRAFIASIVVMVVTGLYIARFRPSLLYSEPRFLSLLAVIFLIILFGARLTLGQEVYVYPAALLSLLYVAITGPHIAIIGTLGLAFLMGLMSSNSLETATLVTATGIIGALTLRRAERLNSFFAAGLMISLVEIAVVAIFNLAAPTSISMSESPLLLAYALIGGILTAAAAVVALYVITLIFNLPTALKLIELSQPTQPLLQRLLREAPGTYQHSLQVANLGEQAAAAIGANSSLVHVAALYHDIGKMLNPAFFTENQRDVGNPHDALNDPYRSADIIIQHVTGGDDMARQFRLPARIRDFIREHHGTTLVTIFYHQAVALSGGDASAVEMSDFTYPGPKPHSRETAILMLADSCEAAVRSQQPRTQQEIEDTVNSIIHQKQDSGQLDDSGLSLGDLRAIRRIFIDMLKATFHPRINYAEAIARARGEIPSRAAPDDRAAWPEGTAARRSQTMEVPSLMAEEDDSPLPDVPPLRRSNGKPPESAAESPADSAPDSAEHDAPRNASGDSANAQADLPNNEDKD